MSIDREVLKRMKKSKCKKRKNGKHKWYLVPDLAQYDMMAFCKYCDCCATVGMIEPGEGSKMFNKMFNL